MLVLALVAGVCADHGGEFLCETNCDEVTVADSACGGAVCNEELEDLQGLCTDECMAALIELVSHADRCTSERDEDDFLEALESLQETISGLTSGLKIS